MRYDKMCEAFGGYGEYVTKPEDIRPALERAQAKVDEGMVALVNVRTDYRARYGGVRVLRLFDLTLLDLPPSCERGRSI